MRVRLKTTSLLVVSALVLAASGAEGGEGGSASGARDQFPMTVDNCGRQVTFEERPQRVLALHPEAAMMVAAAGAGDRIRAYAGFLVDVPFGEAGRFVMAAENLGPIPEDIPLEEIIATRPDVVIGGGGELAEDLAPSGIPTLIVGGYCASAGFPLEGDPSVFDLINDDIETYGALFGTQDTASRAVAELRQRVAAVEEQVTNEPRVATAALYMWADGPLAAYGNLAIVDDQLNILGLRNVFGDTDERYFEPSVEEIIERNPELLIALYNPEESQLPTPESVLRELRSRTELAGVSAMQDGAILPFRYHFSGPGPLAVDGLEQLAEWIVTRK